MYDVVIVGAGPAGLFCAYELVENNLEKVFYKEEKSLRYYIIQISL